jgi:peroxiredoxin
MDKPKKKFPVSILVLAAIAALFGFGTGLIIINSRPTSENPVLVLPTSNVQGLAVGSSAPDFTLNTLAGQAVSLKELRGKRVLINFWASWCPPCLAEIPDLKAAYNQLREENVAFIGIGTQDETDKLKQFSGENDLPYTVVEDPKGNVSDSYGVLGLPTTVLVDSTGVVRKVFTGPITKDQVIAELGKIN